MAFGKKLRTLRKKAGMSQKKLAEKLNISRQAVIKQEAESEIPNIENIIRVICPLWPAASPRPAKRLPAYTDLSMSGD